MIKNNIPNAITCLNCLCGTLAIIAAFHGVDDTLWGLSGYQLAAVFIALAAVADFLDGLSARLLHAVSGIGKELDSLSDLVSFGVAPAMMILNVMHAAQPESAVTLAWDTINNASGFVIEYGRQGFTRGQGDTLRTTQCTLTVPDLSLTTLYDFYVSAVCNQTGAVERPAAYIVARAGCAQRSLPYSENFDGYTYNSTQMLSFTIDKESLTDRWYERPSQFPNGLTMPACWQFPNQSVSGYWPQAMMYHGMYAEGCYDQGSEATGQCLMLRNLWDGGSDWRANYAALPAFSAPLRKLIIEFDYRYSSHWDTCSLQLGYMTDLSLPASFVPLARTETNCTTYAHYRYDFSQAGLYLPDDARIAFKYKGNYEHRYIFIDNVRVYEADSCRMVQDVRFEKIADDTILMGWTTLPEATNYRIVYGRHGFPIDTGTVAYSTVNSISLPVMANTVYDFYITPYCSACDDYGKTRLTVYRTPCGEKQPLPYFEDFNYYTKNVADEYYFSWNHDQAVNNSGINSIEYPTNHAIGQCCTYPGRSTGFRDWESPKDWLTNYPGLTAGDTGNAQILRSNSGRDVYMIFPLTDTALRYIQLKIDYRAIGEGYVTTADLGYVTTPNTYPPDFVVAKHLVPTNYYKSDSVTFIDVPNDGVDRYAAIRYRYDPWNYYECELFVDNVEITVPKCLEVSGFALHDEMAMIDGTFGVDWTGPENSLGYLIEYGPKDFIEGTGTFDSIITDSIVLSGLECRKEYDIYVRTLCDACDSRERAKWTFRAPCTVFQLPYVEDFDKYTENTDNPSHYAQYTRVDTNYMPPCWTYHNSGNWQQWNASYCFMNSHHNTEQSYQKGNASYYYYDPYRSLGIHSYNTVDHAIAVVPKTVRMAQDMGISFKYKVANQSYGSTILTWGVMTDPRDKSTYIPSNQVLECNQQWRSVDLADAAEQLPDSVREDLTRYYWLAFRCENRYGQTDWLTAFIDSVVITEAPEICRKPVVYHPADTDVTDNSIIVRWKVLVNHAQDFTIAYSPYDGVYEDFDGRRSYTYYPVAHPLSRPVDAQGYRTERDTLEFVDTIRGLSPNTEYEIAVLANCGSEGYSRWSDTVRVTTQCGREVLPYIESFDGYTAGETESISHCWTKGTNSSTPYPYPTSSYAAPQSSPNSLQFYGDATYYSYAAMSLFEESETGLVVSYKIRANNNNGASISLVVIPDMSDPTNYTVLATHNGSTGWQSFQDIILPEDYTSDMGRLAFVVGPINNGRQNNIFLDDVVVDKYRECLRPTSFAKTYEYSHHALVSLINNAGVSLHHIAIGPRETFDIDNPATYNTYLFNTDTLTGGIKGLSAVTAYTMAIRAVCGEGDTSLWSNTINVTTKNDNTDILEYAITSPSGTLNGVDIGQIDDAIIDHENSTITVYVRPSTPFTGIIATFKLADSNAVLNAYSIRRNSGEEPALDLQNNGTVPYLVLAEDQNINQAWTLQVIETQCALPGNISFDNVMRRRFTVNWTQQDDLPHDLIVSDTVVTNFQAWIDNGRVVSLAEGVNTYTTPLVDRNVQYHVYVRSNCLADDMGVSEWIYSTVRTRDLYDCPSPQQDSVRIEGKGSVEDLWYIPMVMDQRYSYSQSIYLTDEIRPGKIKRIVIQHAWTNYTWTQADQIKIYLGYTDKDYFSNRTDWQTPNTLTKVFDGGMTSPYNGSNDTIWQYIDLDEPFVYDGHTNLLMAIQDNNSINYNTNYRFRTDILPQARYMYYYSGGAPYDIEHPVAATDGGSPNTHRVRTRFIYCDEIDPCPSVDTVIAELGVDSTSTASATWGTVEADYPNGYDLIISTDEQQSPNTLATQFGQYHKTVADGYTMGDTLLYEALQINSQAFAGLHPNTLYHVYVRANCIGDPDKKFAEWKHTTFKTKPVCRAPRNLRVSISGGVATVSWDKGLSTQGDFYAYRIDDHSQLNDTMTLAGAQVSGCTSRSVSFYNLHCGRKYYFYVANDCGSASSPWEVITFTMPECCVAPVNISASPSSPTSVNLSWEAGEGSSASEYEVIYYTGMPIDSQNVAQRVVTNNTSINIPNLINDTTYHFYVRSICGTDRKSKPLSVTVKMNDTTADFTRFWFYIWNRTYEGKIDRKNRTIDVLTCDFNINNLRNDLYPYFNVPYTVDSVYIGDFANKSMRYYDVAKGTDPDAWYNLDDYTTIIQGNSCDHCYPGEMQDIGFSFTIGTTTHTQYTVTGDSRLSFNTDRYSGDYGTPLNQNNYTPKIVGLGCDGGIWPTGYIRTQLFGTAPSRVRVVEYRLNTWAQRGNTDAECLFQIQLFESTNTVRIVYGPAPTVLPNPAYQIGMKSTENYTWYVSSSDQITFVAGNTGTGGDVYQPANTWPGDYKWYSFTPQRNVRQVSAQNRVDFSSGTVKYTIQSEYSSVAKDWTVNVICPRTATVCQYAGYEGQGFSIPPERTAVVGLDTIRDTIDRVSGTHDSIRVLDLPGRPRILAGKYRERPSPPLTRQS